MRRSLIVLTLLAAFVCAAPAADALTRAQLRTKLTARMARAGGASGAYVVDLTSGRRLYGSRGGTPRVPASNEKLYTSVAALRELGDDGTLRTTALATKPLTLDGTLDGDLYLRGGGDPTLDTARLEALAQDLRDAGLSKVTGRVIGDESAFDTLRGPPSEGYGPSSNIAPLGALMVNRGFANGRYQPDPPAYAASVLAQQLRQAGVRVSKQGRAGTTPPGALALAVRDSPTVTLLLKLMNVPSDNYIAEMLLKAIGRTGSQPGTTARGAAVARQDAERELGTDPVIVDGSGLSRSDRTSPRDVVTLLETMAEDPAFYGSLAVMGRTGTLADRLRHDYARGRCRGKTGSLSDVSALSGYCETSGGDFVAFSLLMNRVNVDAARDLQDAMVAAIARFVH